MTSSSKMKSESNSNNGDTSRTFRTNEDASTIIKISEERENETQDQELKNNTKLLGHKDTIEDSFLEKSETNKTNDNVTLLDTKKESLNEVYGNRIGILQTLSMILNAGLMIYAHVGVSALILSNRQRIDEQVANNNNNNNNSTSDTTNSTTSSSSTGVCNAADMLLWQNGANANRSKINIFCSTSYLRPNSNALCLIDSSCNAECFETVFGFSAACATCLGAIPFCGFQAGCVSSCSSDSPECATCTQPCTDAMYQCTGFPVFNQSAVVGGTVAPTMAPTIFVDNSLLSNEQVCAKQQDGVDWADIRNNDEVHVVYTLTFTHAIADAWNGNARFLAFFIVLFSGMWPYMKNIILVYTWYKPMTSYSRHLILIWMKRLGKYTLVDIYAVIVIMIGVLINANIQEVPVIVTAEPRPAIVAFLIATFWEFIHFEWMTQLHHQHYHKNQNPKNTQPMDIKSDPIDNKNPSDNVLTHLFFLKTTENIHSTNVATNKSQEKPTKTTTSNNDHMDHDDDSKINTKSSTPVHSSSNVVMECKNLAGLQVVVLGLLFGTIITYITGALLNLASFETLTGSNHNNVGCTKSYTLFSLGTELVSKETFLIGNQATTGTWIMFLSYLMLVGFCPWITLFVQTFVLLKIVPLQSSTSNNNTNSTRWACRIADISWSFASIEILLLALILVEVKFEQLIASLAGEDNSQFFGIVATVQPGFFVLILYSILAGILQYIFNSAVSEYYNVDSYHRIDPWWTYLFQSYLKDKVM